MLLRTGWGRHSTDRKATFGSDVPGARAVSAFRRSGSGAVRLLVEDRRVIGLGVDTASIDYGPSLDFPVHRLVASRNVIGLENLMALEELPPRGATIVALPMKIEGGSGGPVRAIAMVPAYAAAAAGRRVPFIVSPAYVADRLGQPDLVVVHVGDKAGYDAGHIAGARQLWLDAISRPRGEGLNLELPGAAELQATFGRLGVSDSSQVVLYFGKDQATPTSRVFLTLDYLGLGDRVSYLDGGLPAWQAAGLPVVTETPAVASTTLKTQVKASAVTDAAWVAANRTAPGVVVVDARAPEFYTGESNPNGRYARPGHVAGAKNIPYSSLLTASGYFRSRPELEALFREAGIEPDDTVVSYCHIGQQASLVYFVARSLGYDARLYDGSYEEWSAKPELPVEAAKAAK